MRSCKTIAAIAAGFVVAAGAVTTATPGAQAASPFNPVLTASTSTDAARAATSFSARLTQNDGEEQIGQLSIALPRSPGFVLNTDIPGSNGGQIGTIRVVLYTDPRPATLAVDGTLNDDNARAGCGGATGRQCIIANLTVPGIGTVAAQLEIYELAGAYSVQSDLTSTWADPNVAAINARLAELSTTIFATTGTPTHTVLRNPSTAGSWPVAYSFTSASVPSRGLTGGLTPPCAPNCAVNLLSKEYAPSAPGQSSPAANGAYLSTAPINFSWGASTDRNGDDVTYTLLIDGTVVASGSPTSVLRPAGSIAPGRHTWQVRADDGHSTPVSSTVSAFTIVDPAAALTFISATNGDRLYLDTTNHAFVYQINGGNRHGAEAASVTAERGSIAFTSGFNLVLAYDTATNAAAGVLVAGQVRREFADAPG